MHKMSDTIENLLTQLIKKDTYKTQGSLVTALKKNGVSVKQSSVSRALHRIGAVKRRRSDGTIGYQIMPTSTENNTGYTRELVTQIAHNEAMIVVTTGSGSASHVAQYIDDQNYDDILGTLAGDNCILILPKSLKTIPALTKTLARLFPRAIVLK